MSFLRVYESFGLLVTLLTQCLSDISVFMIFLFTWIIMFAIFFMLIGMNPDEPMDTDFNAPRVNKIVYYLLMSWTNSVGVVFPPMYEFWNGQIPEDRNAEDFWEGEAVLPSLVMVYIIWFVWTMNQLVVFIILLNFLIAMISQSYEQVMSISTQGLYKHRRDLNVTSQLMLRYFNLLKPIDYILISCNVTSGGDGEQWYGFVHTIRNFVNNSNTALREVI